MRARAGRGGPSLPAKGRKLEVACFAIITNNTNNNTKRSPRPPRGRAGRRVRGGSARPSAPALRSDGGGAPKPALRTVLLLFPFFFFFFKNFLFAFSLFPFSLSALHHPFRFSFSLSSLSSPSSVLLSFLLSRVSPGPLRSPARAPLSVGEDQVGDAGLEPVSRDHLAHLGRAVVRELEVRAGARLEVKIQVPVERRRRAEAAQGHALKV